MDKLLSRVKFCEQHVEKYKNKLQQEYSHGLSNNYNNHLQTWLLKLEEAKFNLKKYETDENHKKLRWFINNDDCFDKKWKIPF